ncbi:MAG: DUF1501 domain-containing protein [Vicinamibacterales bacterium]
MERTTRGRTIRTCACSISTKSRRSSRPTSRHSSTTCRFATVLFDTHVNQASPHDRQLEYCADAIDGFFHEMQRIGRADDVVMYVHSEFGRRVPENTSLGTDHGTAQVNFVVGNAVKGGFYGTAPSLSDLVLGDNLESTTDFRHVYASLIAEWLGVDASKVLGQSFDTLGLFRVQGER